MNLFYGEILVILVIHLRIVSSNTTLKGAYGQVSLTPLKDNPTRAEFTFQIAAHDTSPSAFRSLALFWSQNAFFELAVPIYGAITKSEQSFSGNVTLTLRGDRLSFKIDGTLLRALEISCLSEGGDDFFYEARIPPTTRVIVLQIVPWSTDQLSNLPVVSLNVDENGLIQESLPDLAEKCQSTTLSSSHQEGEGDYDDDAPMDVQVIRGHFHFFASADDSSNKLVAHADDYQETAEYYALRNEQAGEASRCSKPCIPVLLSLPAPLKSLEYGCRLNAGENAAEWWLCDGNGLQFGLGGILIGGLSTRLRIASSLARDPTPCIDVRNDGSPGRWLRYDNETKKYVKFESENFEDAEDGIITRQAYRCVSSQDGAILKDIFLDDGQDYVKKCDINVPAIYLDKKMRQISDNKIVLECELLSRLAGCYGNRCNETATFVIEPASATMTSWQVAKLSHFVKTEPKMIEKNRFRLSIDFSGIQPDRQLVGDYNIFLHFRNNVNLLAGQFRIDEAPSTVTVKPSTTLEPSTDYYADIIDHGVIITGSLETTPEVPRIDEKQGNSTTLAPASLSTGRARKLPRLELSTLDALPSTVASPQPYKIDEVKTVFSGSGMVDESSTAAPGLTPAVVIARSRDRQTSLSTAIHLRTSKFEQSTLTPSNLVANKAKAQEEELSNVLVPTSKPPITVEISEKTKEEEIVRNNFVLENSSSTIETMTQRRSAEESTLTPSSRRSITTTAAENSTPFDFTIYGTTQLIDQYIENLGDETAAESSNLITVEQDTNSSVKTATLTDRPQASTVKFTVSSTPIPVSFYEKGSTTKAPDTTTKVTATRKATTVISTKISRPSTTFFRTTEEPFTITTMAPTTVKRTETPFTLKTSGKKAFVTTTTKVFRRTTTPDPLTTTTTKAPITITPRTITERLSTLLETTRKKLFTTKSSRQTTSLFRTTVAPLFHQKVTETTAETTRTTENSATKHVRPVSRPAVTKMTVWTHPNSIILTHSNSALMTTKRKLFVAKLLTTPVPPFFSLPNGVTTMEKLKFELDSSSNDVLRTTKKDKNKPDELVGSAAVAVSKNKSKPASRRPPPSRTSSSGVCHHSLSLLVLISSFIVIFLTKNGAFYVEKLLLL